MEDKDIEKEVMYRIMAESIAKAIFTNTPADIALDSDFTTEKKMAWIELHEDVLEEAYDMSKEYREYD
jgi:hypothetical protein